MDIPEDVVTQILVRLPVKSLLRFRCVCKDWCGLIGSRRFIDTHLRHPSRGNGKSYLVLRRFESDLHDECHPMLSFYDADLKAAAPDWMGFPDKVSIGGPVNGVCLVGGELCAWGIESDGEHPLYLFNPATRELRKIPDRPFGRQRARPTRFNFGFGQPIPFECQRVSVGLGYDSRTRDYKVVSIMLFLEDHYYENPPYGPLKIEIYDLSSNSWRVTDTVFPTIHLRPDLLIGQPDPSPDVCLTVDTCEGGMFEEFTCGLFLGGSIHWQAFGFTRAILAFNASDEVIQAFHLPRDVTTYHNRSRSLFVLDESLAFVQRVLGEDIHYSPTSSFYVWVITEYGDEESWIKRFYFQPGIHMDVLAFWNGMLFRETVEDGELYSCNLHEDPHFRRHDHFTRHVPQLSSQQRVQHGLHWNTTTGDTVMHKESLVRLS